MSKLPFDQWYKQVGHVISAVAGLHIDDLPDCPYQEWYEKGNSPKIAAHKAVKRAKE